MTDKSPEECKVIVDRLEKRFGEVAERACVSRRMRCVWTDDVMTVVHYEIDRCLNGVDCND